MTAEPPAGPRVIARVRELFFYQDQRYAEQYAFTNERGEFLKGYVTKCARRNNADCRAWKEALKRPQACQDCPHKALVPVSDAAIADHLALRRTMGAYQLRDDGTAGWLALDCDIQDDDAVARQNVRLMARTLRDKLRHIGVPTYVEFTGKKGFHLWVFTPEGCDARLLQRLGRWAVRQAEEELGELAGVHVEVFPKQTNLDTAEGIGNCVKVPLGLHQVSRKRCVFLNDDFSIAEDQAAFLDDIDTLTADVVQEIVAAEIGEESEGEHHWQGGPLTDALGRRLTAPRLARRTKEFLEHGAEAGSRNIELFAAACDLYGNGVEAEQIAAMLIPLVVAPDFPESEAETVIASATSQERLPAVPERVLAPPDDNVLTVLAPDGTAVEEPTGRYAVDEHGRIVFLKPKPVRRNGEIVFVEWTPILVTNFTAKIIREIELRDGDDFESSYVMEGQAPRGHWVAEIGGEDFRDERLCKAKVGAAAGASAIIYQPRHLPTAIQELSTEIETQVRYQSTGWQMVEGKLTFVTPRGSEGACVVSQELDRYDVRPGDWEAGADALLNGLLETFEHKVTYPCVAHAFLAPLLRWITNAKRYCLHLVGQTGSHKTAFGCCLLALFGPDFANEEPTTTWMSTANSTERMGHEAKDVLFLVDDYKKRTCSVGAVTQLLHLYSDGRGRARMNRDASLKKTYRIRGALLSTGEDVPQGEASVIARMLILHVPKREGLNTALRYAQDRSAHLSALMYEFVRWVTERERDLETALPRQVLRLRDEFLALSPAGRTNPGRVATNIAQNKVAFQCLCLFLKDKGVLSEEEVEARLKEYDAIALQWLGEMADAVTSEKASQGYLQALTALIESGEGVLLAKEHEPQATDAGTFLGWQDNYYIYLSPTAAFHAAERWFRSVGGTLGFSQAAVELQLVDDGLVIPSQNRPTVAARVGSRVRRVLKLRRSAFEADINELFDGNAPAGGDDTEGDDAGTEELPF